MAFLQKKVCSICGEQIPLFRNAALRDGNCCPKCVSLLSPWFSGLKKSTVAAIKEQVLCRKFNQSRLSCFHATRTFGNDTQVLIDEPNRCFAITQKGKCKLHDTDIISCTDLISCTYDVVEHTTEIKYKDSTDEVKSFFPPSFAYSYDFFVTISVSIPYIGTIRFKVNNKPIDNGQETLIRLDKAGVLDLIKDRLSSRRAYPGGVSNANEVMMSAQYQQCQRLVSELCQVLSTQRTIAQGEKSPVKISSSTIHQQVPEVHVHIAPQIQQPAQQTKTVYCTWCGAKIPENAAFCQFCGGKI